MTRRTPLQHALLAIALLLFALFTLLPMLWLFMMSVSSTTDLTTVPLAWLPRQWDFSRYEKLLSAGGGAGRTFLGALANSCTVAFSATAISMLAAIPAAYSFSRVPGRAVLLHASLAVYMMPPVAFVLPLYLVFSALGLLNTTLALVIVYCSILLPFCTWLLKNNFDALPVEIEQAARVDGAGVLGVIWHVTLPLAKPALGATALFALMLAWDEFFYALIYTSDLRAKTLPVAIGDFAAGRATDHGLISAAGVLSALPAVLTAALLQRWLVSGLTAGGTKG
ncbi:carbohydrate ABC transporter permease [Piscinibacter terrae]|uniref:Maltose/maltodextrin transport system permease protein MalG n=1 Tax=Piscinibacter terrae TaxID=2496871 RepID=A0A3N7JVV7_9BURK|nr:carbohydrate ABC transporter permease [Albitalea terrae]RQP23005.1 carbohydrate ABC transporter permease [Albitalea terrae]